MPPRKRNNPKPAIRPVANAPKTTRASAPCDSKEPLAGSEMPKAQSPMTVQESSNEAPQALLGNLGPALQLLPYQRRWVEDNSHLKIVAKARQIGYSFAASIRALLECLKRKTTWIFLSKGERQSRLLMEKVQEHVQSCGILARACESTFFEGTLIKQLEVRFANGSVIYGLPANPDTARGYSGNVTLDEFAFHSDADKIYTALFPSITRGYCLEIISTPNGQQGKFYELAKAAGLVDSGDGEMRRSGEPSGDLEIERSEEQDSGPGSSLVTRHSSLLSPDLPIWSGHRVDIYEAIRQGLTIDLQILRAGCGDETTWQQEYCCQFISTAENFIPPALVSQCVSAEASKDCPPQFLASAPHPGLEPIGAVHEPPLPDGEFYVGIDIGRHHDRTVFWLDRVTVGAALVAAQGAHEGRPYENWPGRAPALTGAELERVAVARLVRTFSNTPFAEQLAFARELLSLPGPDGRPLVRRVCLDATGMGAPLAESLEREFGPRVEPVTFTAAVKEDLAYRVKRRMEQRLDLIPEAPEIARAFGAVKKLVTVAGNTRFDAERTDLGHADEFWAKALADLAAERPISHLSDGAIVGTPRAVAWMPFALPAEF
ncbi:MAG: terminase large subunit domain-containing protein [Terriglobia bacterium]